MVSADQQHREGKTREIPLQSSAPATFRFRCSSCQMLLEVAAKLAGARAPCPGCRRMITAPRPEACSTDSSQYGTADGEVRSGEKKGERSCQEQSCLATLSQEEFSPDLSPSLAEPTVRRVRKVRRERKRRKRPAKAQREDRSRADLFADRVPVRFESYREKGKSIARIRLALAFLLTIVAVIGVIRITKKAVAGPPSGREEGSIGNRSR